jgi:uncharacterized protein (TIGR01244 family)
MKRRCRRCSSAGLAALMPLVLLVAAAPSVQAQVKAPEQADPSLIPNYRLVRPGIATSGQPTDEGLRRLKELGFRTVINLRTEKEGAREEKEQVEAAGLRYVWVPVTPDTFSMADVESVARVLDDEGAEPTLVHCAVGSRVGAVWTVREVLRGKDLEAAEREGREIGLGGAMIPATRRLAEEARKR